MSTWYEFHLTQQTRPVRLLREIYSDIPTTSADRCDTKCDSFKRIKYCKSFTMWLSGREMLYPPPKCKQIRLQQVAFECSQALRRLQEPPPTSDLKLHVFTNRTVMFTDEYQIYFPYNYNHIKSIHL